MSQNELDKIKEDIQVLQYRMGGAEYLIKVFVKKMHPNEVNAIENEIAQAIKNCGSNSPIAKILDESLRLLDK